MIFVPQYCPLCHHLKYLVRYHISYNPEVLIYACQDCNEIEYKLRRGFFQKLLHPIITYRIIKLYRTHKF